MIELQLFLKGNQEAADRLRALLVREGFRIEDAADTGADAHLRAVEEGQPDGPEHTARRIEELDLAVRELRNLDVAKSQFLANVSHELRTPLTAIVTYGEVLRDGLLGEVTDRQQEAIQSVIGSGRQLLSMIEEILIYARTNARAIEIFSTRFSIDDVVRDVYRMNASLIRKKRLEFQMVVEAGLPPVHADRDKVIHVLGNLMGNAIEFTPPEGGIRVESRPAPNRAGWVEVAVVDTGIGIDPEHHEMIFHEFAQVDSSRARQHHGTGLGLAIARNFIHLHGGEVWVESELGRGSRFAFTLPAADTASSKPGDA